MFCCEKIVKSSNSMLIVVFVKLIILEKVSFHLLLIEIVIVSIELGRKRQAAYHQGHVPIATSRWTSRPSGTPPNPGTAQMILGVGVFSLTAACLSYFCTQVMFHHQVQTSEDVFSSENTNDVQV
ncbi:hypothetical protein L1987_63196 [Smallanthus sonchifolius]|uniref:Uncharacterized protein n=1 Tax=Smallanthus sonchifolius TaxID=185202 RepID=A0ACB9CCP1_9ASTR|nr:hypothetical protein L1987_63196 [Smallanthus sonchifolius]